MADDDLDDKQLHPVVWVLADYAAGASPGDLAKFVASGILPLLLDRLDTISSQKTKIDTFTRIGTIAANGCAISVKEAGGWAKVLPYCNESTPLDVQRAATLAFKSMSVKPNYPVDDCKDAFAVLTPLVADPTTDEQVVANACAALALLSVGGNQILQALLDTGIAGRLVELLSHSKQSIQDSALRTIGNIATGNYFQCMAIIHLGVLGCLQQGFLAAPVATQRKEACWVAANLAVFNGNDMVESNIFSRLIDMLSTEESKGVREEIFWAIANGMSCAELDLYLVRLGAIQSLCKALAKHEELSPRLIQTIVEALRYILYRTMDEGGAGDSGSEDINDEPVLRSAEVLAIMKNEGLAQILEPLKDHFDIDAKLLDYLGVQDE